MNIAFTSTASKIARSRSRIEPSALASGIERVRRDDEAVRAALQRGELGKRPHVRGLRRKIDQEDVPPVERPLDAGSRTTPRSRAYAAYGAGSK